jgi:hypothetical protein
MSKELFKNAIAEAKSVREAAIANAKEALEETITPHLKELLAAKLQEMDEVEEEVMEEEVVDETIEETIEEADGLEEVEVAEAEEDDADQAADDSEEDNTEDHSKEDHSDDEPAPDDEIGDISVEQFKDLVRDIIADEMAAGEEEEELELPADVQGMGDEEMEEPIDDTLNVDEIDLDEMLNEILAEEEIEEGSHNKEEMEEEISEEVEEGSHDKDKMEEELKEALETINTLRQDLQEVNLLNSKLLYVNKVFKANNLTESQKANVIAAFDKAENVKEVKLVFETVSENVVSKQASKPARSVNESKLGSASKATGTTARRPQIISESDQAVLRMQKLAGIIKN